MHGRVLVALSALSFLVGCSSGTSGDSVITTGQVSPSSLSDQAAAPVRPSAGCESGAGHGAVELEEHTIGTGESSRLHLVSSPNDDKPRPLVLDLHGLLEGPAVQALHSELGEFGLEKGFVTVFPSGAGEPISWKATEINSPDLAYLDLVLKSVEDARCIDLARVYATGLSNGAMMTSLLACTRSGVFAAFAPVNGLAMPLGCKPDHKINLLAFHGTSDPILHFNGGINLDGAFGKKSGGPTTTTVPADLDGAGYPATAEQWAEQIGCAEPVDKTTATMTTRTWTCESGASLTFDMVNGQGHGWPGSPFAKKIESIVGPSAAGIDANAIMWDFFLDHSLTV